MLGGKPSVTIVVEPGEKYVQGSATCDNNCHSSYVWLRVCSDGTGFAGCGIEDVRTAARRDGRGIHLQEQPCRSRIEEESLPRRRVLGRKREQDLLLSTSRARRTHGSTESEFSENAFKFVAEAGLNYFIRQYIKMGVFVGGANLEIVSKEEGKKGVLSSGLAQ